MASCAVPPSSPERPDNAACSELAAGGGGGGAHRSPMQIVSEKQPRAAMECMNELRARRLLCDVTVSAAGGKCKLRAHRLVLAASSNYFRAMFTSEMQEASQDEIELRDVDPSALSALVDFCYTAKISIEESNVQTLLPAAGLLQLQEIQDMCCEFLKKQLDPTNCLGIRAFADTHACRDLLRVADKFAQHNFAEVVESEEFLMLPLPQLVELISKDELSVRSEEHVYQAVMHWVRHDIDNRRQLLPQVLSHVRLPLVHPKFLVGTVGCDTLVRSSSDCRELVDEAKNYMLLPAERVHMRTERTRARRPVRAGELLYAVGGWCSGDAIATVERMDGRTGDWACCAPMSKRRCGVGVAVLHNLLYAVGGHDGQCYLNTIERYDSHTNQWSADVAPTSTCRTSVGVAVCDGHLYAVGGQDGVSCLNVVERYDAAANRWLKVAAMSTRRLGVAVAVLSNCLYAVGGSDGAAPLSSVERFDPRVGKWQPVAAMYTRRKHLGTAVYNGHLYAVGGRDDATELSSAEVYNAAANQWQPVVAMNSRRSGVGLAVVNGQLYAVGGFDGTTYLKTVEVYDRETNGWRHAGNMNYRRLGGGVGVLKSHASPVLGAAAAAGGAGREHDDDPAVPMEQADAGRADKSV